MPKFTVNQICYFSAAHKLKDYPRACNMLHGHNYKVIIEISSEALNNLGMVVDYYDIEEIAYKHIEKLNHKYLNDLDYFKEVNPTTENVAQWLYNNIFKTIKNMNISNNPKLESISIWETDHNFVKYTEN